MEKLQLKDISPTNVPSPLLQLEGEGGKKKEEKEDLAKSQARSTSCFQPMLSSYPRSHPGGEKKRKKGGGEKEEEGGEKVPVIAGHGRRCSLHCLK